MMALLSAAVLAGCDQKEDKFFSANEDDSPRILNTDIPEWKDGAPETIKVISRDQNFEFEVLVTPADFTTVEWFLDEVKIHEGKTIDMPILAGEYILKIVATTTKGKSTSRTAKLIVNPLAGDPVAGNAVLDRLVAPGANVSLTGQNMDKVVKVALGGVDIDAAYAAGAVTYTVPSELTSGTYRLVLKDADGNEYGAGYVTVSASSVVAGASFSGMAGSEVSMTGLNLDKVESLSAGGQACAITSKTASELKFTIPDLELGDHQIIGLDASGAALSFVNGAQLQGNALLTIVSAKVLWEGHHYVSWDLDDTDPNKKFSAVAVESKSWSPGSKIGVHLSIKDDDVYHQVQFNSMWWNILPGTEKTDIGAATVIEIAWSQEMSELVNSQDGFIICGHGIYVDKITIK